MLELFLILSSLLIISIYTWQKISKRKLNRIFNEIAERLGLSFKSGNHNLEYQPTSKSNILVQIKTLKENKTYNLCINVIVNQYFPFNCRVIDKDKLSEIMKINKMDRILTGDLKFDDTFLINYTNEKLVLALLNSNIRNLILTIMKHLKDFKISENIISVCAQPNINNEEYSISNVDDEYITNILWMINSLIKLAEHLMNKYSIELLLTNAATDTNPFVRKRNLEILLNNCNSNKNNKKINDIINNALDDNNIEVRLFAAIHTGKKGLDYLHKLLESNRDDEKIKAIKIIILLKSKESIEPLTKLFSNISILDIKLEIIKAFKIIGDVGVNELLLEQLHSHNNLQLEIIQALGTCGKLNAVEPLFFIAKQINPITKAAARKSILNIQSRLGKEEKGGLSISNIANEEGALSMAIDTGEGALSVVEEKGE